MDQWELKKKPASDCEGIGVQLESKVQTFSHKNSLINDVYSSWLINKILLIPDTVLMEPAWDMYS